jgi:hypothetical protein
MSALGGTQQSGCGSRVMAGRWPTYGSGYLVSISAGGGDQFHRQQIRTRPRAQELYRAVYQRT